MTTQFAKFKGPDARITILTAVAKGSIYRNEVYGEVLADTLGIGVLKRSTLYALMNELIATEYMSDSVPLMLTDKGWQTLQNELARVERQRLVLKSRLHR